MQIIVIKADLSQNLVFNKLTTPNFTNQLRNQILRLDILINHSAIMPIIIITIIIKEEIEMNSNRIRIHQIENKKEDYIINNQMLVEVPALVLVQKN